MTVRVYRSTDFGAPSLTGAAGGAIPVLSGCLVNGYGDQTVTITRSGTTATITTPVAHGYAVYAMVTISGATEQEYNGDKACTVTSATTLTFTVAGNPTTPASGTINMKIAGAGWTLAFTGTNKAAYKQGVGSNGMYFRVDDTPTTVSRIIGYESMSAVDTGANAFPTDTQFAGGLYLGKSSDTATVRPWVLVANERYFVFISNVQGLATADNSQPIFFGDLISYKSGDVFSTQIAGGTTSSSTSTNSFYSLSSSVSTPSLIGHYIARAQNQSGTALNNSKIANSTKLASGATIGGSGLTYPNPEDGGLYISTLEATESSTMRGRYPGCWCPCHNKPLQHLDYFKGSGALAGKVFMSHNIYSSGQIFLEISDTVYG